MAGRHLSPDVTGVAADARRPERAEGEADYEGDQIIERWGGKHHRTPEAGSPCAIAAAERRTAAVLRWVI